MDEHFVTVGRHLEKDLSGSRFGKSGVETMSYNRKIRVWLAGILFLITCCGNIGWAGTAETWFPFMVPWDDATVTATDVSRLTLDAPAGKHGFLTVKNSHFYFEDGTRIRFLGSEPFH